jgi:ribosome-associated protein
VGEYLRKAGHIVLGVEGTTGSSWVLVDAGGIVVHVFTEEARNLYNIEKIYAYDFDKK